MENLSANIDFASGGLQYLINIFYSHMCSSHVVLTLSGLTLIHLAQKRFLKVEQIYGTFSNLLHNKSAKQLIFTQNFGKK